MKIFSPVGIQAMEFLVLASKSESLKNDGSSRMDIW